MGFADLMAQADRTAREVLGGSVVYRPGVGAPVTVAGVFDAAFSLVDLGDPGVASVGPVVFLGRLELPSDPDTDRDARIEVAGVLYRIHEVRPSLDGVFLLLHRDD